MFTINDLTGIIHALELAIASNARAKNKSRNPEFTELYNKQDAELTATLSKAKDEITKQKQKMK